MRKKEGKINGKLTLNDFKNLDPIKMSREIKEKEKNSKMINNNSQKGKEIKK